MPTSGKPTKAPKSKADADFARWLNEGPKRAKAAGLYVGVYVVDETDEPAMAKLAELDALWQAWKESR